MTADAFRRIALGIEGVSESEHMDHPDFRVSGRIFATLHRDPQWGMVRLPLDEQQRFLESHAAAFSPESGAWGRQGYTRVRLDAVDEDTLGEAMTIAWKDTRDREAAKRSTGRQASKRPARPTAPSSRRRKL